MPDVENNCNFFIPNCEYIKKNNDYLYNKIHEKLNVKSNAESRIDIVKTKNNLVNIRKTIDSMSFFLHSNYDPYKEGSIIADIDDDSFDTIVILGFGLGYHIEQIIERFPEKNKLIIEPDIDVFIACMENRDIRDILSGKNVDVILSSDCQEITGEIINLIRISRIYKIEFVQLGSYNSHYGELWADIKKHYTKFFKGNVINIRTIKMFNHTWMYNYLSNLFHMDKTPNINSFKDKFKNVPAVLISSGPSLSENIHLLKGFEDKALIMASGSAVNAVLEHGIVPHITLGIDGGQDMSVVFNKVDRDDIFLAFVLNLHYDCVNKYRGPKIYIKSTSEPQAEYFEKRFDISTDLIFAGGSVSNVALDFVCKLGCDPIIFIGQDLSFTGMRFRAEGTIGNRSIDIDEAENNSNFIKTKDMFGNDIYSTQVMLTMKYWFEDYFKNSAGKRTFINSSAAGLELEYSTRMDFESALKKYCSESINVREKLKKCHQEGLESIMLSQEDIKLYIREINDSSKNAKELSDKRIKLCRKTIADLEKGNVKSHTGNLKRINSITEELEKDDFYLYFILKKNKDIISVYKHAAEQRASSETILKKKLIILYDGLLKQFLDIEENIVFLMVATNEMLKGFNEGDVKDEQ